LVAVSAIDEFAELRDRRRLRANDRHRVRSIAALRQQRRQRCPDAHRPRQVLRRTRP